MSCDTQFENGRKNANPEYLGYKIEICVDSYQVIESSTFKINLGFVYILKCLY